MDQKIGELEALKQECLSTIKWASIPAGSYDDFNCRFFKINAFEMSVYLITTAQFRLFSKATGWIRVLDNPYRKGVAPAIVSSKDAIAFAKWLNCDLPRESQWEYACQSGTDAHFQVSESGEIIIGNYFFNEDSLKVEKEENPLDKDDPRPWGLIDLHGEYMQWCHNDHENLKRLPKKNSQYLLKGGELTNDKSLYSLCKRLDSSDGYSYRSVGFRIVRSGDQSNS